jgi:hypothetical protein
LSSFFFLSPAMNVLDGDKVRLSFRGQYAERDIVQVRDSLPLFVDFLTLTVPTSLNWH